MALKLPDSAVPMGDFPVAKAVDIDFDDGENLQEKLDNGNLGGGAVDLSEYTKTFTSLSALGLTAPITVGEIFNAMSDNTMVVLACEDTADHITDVPIPYGVLTIKKNESGRFSIDYQNSLQSSPCNVKRWIGTLKGLDGTGLYWKQISTQTTYTALSDMELTADATIQEVIDALPIGCTALLRTDGFTNWSTLFNGVQWGYLKIEKTVNGLSNIELQEVVTPNRRYFGTQSSGKFSAWVYDKANVTLAFNSKTFKIDITKGKESWNGNMKFGYFVDNSYGEIIISSLGTTNVTWSCSEGVRYVKSVTYTIDPDNKAHITIGVELFDIVYGVHQLEMAGDFATINSFTGDAFTGTSVAVREGVRGRNNGVGILYDVADLGLTYPCTTVQIVQAMRNLSTTASRIPQSSMMGIFNVGSKASTITDAPSDYGLLHIETHGHDRIMIRCDGVSGSSHTGSWIGQIQGSNGTFSGITWCRIDIENRVDELFQSVSSGKTLVANAITGKGVSTATDATFATMATNIGKISGGYKEETKSLIVTSNSTGTETLPFKFSADVIAVKRIVAPSDSCRIVPQTSKDMLTINGNELVLYVVGTGTWQATAMVKGS